jgi:hypothetical protein
MAGGIKQAADSNHRIHSESTHIAQPVMNLALQDVVDDGAMEPMKAADGGCSRRSRVRLPSASESAA